MLDGRSHSMTSKFKRVFKQALSNRRLILGLTTTCIGAYPKPEYVPIADWFQHDHGDPGYTDKVLRGWQRGQSEEAQALLDRATHDAIADQIDCGIDIPTDGEIRRENYVHYQCRYFNGFDFDNLTEVSLRNGAYTSYLPTIRDAISAPSQSVLVRDWQIAQAKAGSKPVKMTLPGPMTISDTTADAHYYDPGKLAADLALALNAEVRALAQAGCTYIQIDEPIFARKPAHALDFGIEALERCFQGIGSDVRRVVHICCGYPNQIDDEDYPKADPQAYEQIAQAIDGKVDEISIEDAHRNNPHALFELFEKSALIVGFVRVASSRLESVDEIAGRMDQVLKYVPQERLIAAPDCGLGFLGRELAMKKLLHLCGAASRF